MRRLGLFLLGTVLSFSQVLYAQQISETAAKNKALSFFNSRPSNDGGALRAAKRGGSNSISPETQVSLAYTAGENGTNYFYVYNKGENDGYVIVGGDEQAKEILAYVPQGHFDYDSLPENLRWWLGQYANEIDTAIIMASHMPASARNAIRRNPTSNTLQDIPDLITTKWDQGSPYNNAIPSMVVGEETLHCPTGCVPTALAQIMNYWKYPIQGIGSKSYTLAYSDINQSITYSADFANTTYDWSNMIDQYVEGQYTTAQANAVSTLMYHIGVALQVSYGYLSTSYFDDNGIDRYNGTNGLMRDLPAYFGYDEGMQLVNREDFTLDQWKTLLYNELSAGRPVYYSGHNETGHSFVCHGYSSDLDMFSFNWGWGGQDDGYFSLSGTNAVNGFTLNLEQMLIGIRPKGHNCGVSELTFGDKFMVDGIWYKVWDEKKREVEVTHTTITDWHENRDITDFDYCKGNVTIPSFVQHNGIDYTVSRIGVSAFVTASNAQTNITSIALPPTITSLGTGAFYACGLISDSIIIPDAVEIIPSRCFEQCNRSPYISIPSSVKSISWGAYYACTLLEEISLPEGCYKISSFAFCGCNRLAIVNLPSSLCILGGKCFSETSLIKMTFPCDKFVSAETYTEGEYSYLTTNPFPSSVEEEGVLYVPEAVVDTFRNTTDPHWKKWRYVKPLNELNPNIGKRFNADGFEYMILNDSCVTLSAVTYVDRSKTCITVPSSVTFNGITYKVKSLAAGAGGSVNGIDKLVLSEGIKAIGESALHSCDFKYIEFPNSLEKIGTNAFNGCYELESLDIPGSVKVVQGFQYCPSLKQVILHEGTQSMGANFLSISPKLKEVFFPSSICHYAGGIMTDCNLLSSIVSLSDSLTFELIDNTFASGYGSNHESVSLYIPEQYLSDDKSDYNNNYPWTDFPNKLQYVALESFKISDTLDIVVNEQRMIHQEFFPANASYKQLKWKSSDEDIVMVNCEGYIYAMSEGEVIITASSVDGSNIVSSCVVRVHAAAIPPKASYYCAYIPDFIHNAVFSTQQDTISFAFSSEDGELYLAFDLNRTTSANHNLYFSIGSEVYDIVPTSHGNTKEIILHFDNVRVQDTLRMMWNKINDADLPIPGSLIISNIRIWNPKNYIPPTYAISYYLDGTMFRTDSIQYGETIVSATDPVKEGYTFSGWSEIPNTMPAHDVIVSGSFSLNSYLLTCKVDGIVVCSDSIAYGNALTEIQDIKEGYTFCALSEIPETMPAHDITVTGTLSINSYLLTYTVDGIVVSSDSIVYGSALTARPDSIKEGYKFSGWSEIPATMPANDVIVTGSFSIKTYVLIFKVDDKTVSIKGIAFGEAPADIPQPTKEGYTFSGWSEIPATMPAHNVVITGSFSINKYLLKVLVDSKVVYSDSIEYGTRLADYVDLIMDQGIDITQWEWYSLIETITMPAHDVVINAVLDKVISTIIGSDNSTIYDLTGKKIETNDIITLPAGIYIRNGKKFIVQ